MKKIFRFLIFLPIFFASCEEEQISPIPNYPVRLELDLLGEYNTFKGSVGQQLTFVERKKETDRIGFGGILVCTISTGEYCAFDLACPVEVKADVRVRPDGLFAVCDKCGSTYDIWETNLAVPAGGEAKHPLKKYKISLNANGILRVFR